MSIIFTPFKVETMAGMFSVDLCQKQYLNPPTSENYNKKSQKCSSCFDVKKRVKFLQIGVTFEDNKKLEKMCIVAINLVYMHF